jgi:hypothetical protein
MSAPASNAPAQGSKAESAPLVVATALPAPDDGLTRVSWPRTALRLALEPALHPWSAHWRLRRRAPVTAVVVALLLLLLFALSGCSSAPLQSLRSSAPAPAPSEGLRCESVVMSHELQVPPEGELGDLRLTIDALPQTTGKLRVLVRRPRFPAALELPVDGKAEFDKVLDLSPGAGQRSLTIVLSRPRRAGDDWPRRECKACRVDVELTGLFGARQALATFFARAMQEASEVDAAFSAQSGDAAGRPSVALRDTAEAMIAEAKRCGVDLKPGLRSALAALAQLDRARAVLYRDDPALPDAAAVRDAWETASSRMEGVVASAAREAGWPASLRPGSAGRLRAAAIHIDAVAQVASLEAEDRGIAARFVGLALASDPATLQRRLSALPPIRDLDDAQARLDWVNPRPGASLPIPGVSHPAAIRIRDWTVPIRGRRCIGPGGAAPVRDPEAEANNVARLLGGDRERVRIGRPADIPAVRQALRRSDDLLCDAPQPEVGDLFQDLAGKDLGPIAERLEEVFAQVDTRREHDAVARAILARATNLLCATFDEEALRQRISTVAGYRVFVDGGTRLLEVVPQPLVCGTRLLTPREIRRRLRALYREALDRHALKDRLCPVRAGKCPDEVAASVRRIFGLHRPDLAAPAAVESRRLDFPPPFGFSDEWVQKLDRCAQEACDALAQLRGEAPPGQFDGNVCPEREQGVERPQEVTLASPESPSSVTLSSCDPHAGVRLTLHRLRDAGTLVAIASAHPFRYGSENVVRQGRHPQLGRIYERVADLTDSGDVSRRSDSTFEVALTPTVPNQVFWFFSLRRRDY